MDEKILSFIPFVLVLTIIFLFMLRSFPMFDKKLFTKLFLWLFITSSTFIFLFGTFYTIIFVSNFESTLKLVNDGQRVISEIEYFKGLTFNADEKYQVFIDLYSLSALNFFGLNHTINLVGTAQLILIIERFIGATLPLVVLSLVTLNHVKKREDGKAILFALINQGWRILSVDQSIDKGIHKVELINIDTEIERELLYVNDHPDVFDALRYFKVKWKTADKRVIRYFLKIISEELRGDDSELAYEALKYYLTWDDLTIDDFSSLYSYLLKVQGTMYIFKSSKISFSDFEYVLARIKKHSSTVAEEGLND